MTQAIDENEYISVSAGTHLEREIREAESEKKFVKIEDGGYQDLVFYPNDPERNKIIEGTYNGQPTGRKKNLYLVHGIFLDDSKLQQLEVGMNSAIEMNKFFLRMRQDVCPCRVYRKGEQTSTKYWVRPLRLVENEVPAS